MIVIALAALAGSASASTNISGTGEPAFTNSVSNTNWVGWTKFNSYYKFYLAFYAYTNGTQSGPYNSSLFGGTGFNASNVSGEESFTWNGVTLNEGSTYGVCASGQYTLDNSNLFFPESQSSCGAGIIDNKRSTTTIDRTKPQIQVAVSGTDEYTKTVPVPVTISYNDNLAFPFPANFICARTGTEPAAAAASCNAPGPAQYNYNNLCSVPANPSSKVTSFSCTVTDSPPLPDGPVTVCAISADSAVPDNPSSSNQFNATASQANLSPSQCGYVRLDRTAPQLSFTAPATVKVGDLVTANGTVTDGGSGASGTVAWTWGDNTVAGAGISATHTYTQPGTFTITMSSGDKVGNAAQTTKTITVAAAPSGGGGGTPPGGGGTPPGGGAPGGGSATGGGGTVTPPPSVGDIARQVGGTGAAATQTTSAGSLDVLTARRVRLSPKLKALPIALTAETAGKASFALVRGGRIASKAGLTITKPGSLGFKLKLPKKFRPGKYSLKITFLPAGGSNASVKSITITFAAAKAKAGSATAPVTDSAALIHGTGPRLLPTAGFQR